jgi:2-polyprenyl-6-methoxyphenol hydroxylase-like FAD-dependent oxidoreductase
VHVHYGTALVGFHDDGTGIDAEVAPAAGGEPQRVRAAFLVGADGARSHVRRALGIEWTGESGAQRDFMGGRMYAIYLRSPQLRAAMPHDPAWMHVTVNHERRVFMATVDGEAEYAFHAAVHPGEDADRWTHADARRVFEQAMGLPVPIEILSTQTWTAGHALVAGAFRRGRVLLAGDAAHLFTPTGGLGYNTAVEDAVNLGWKLAALVRGRGGDALLASYEQERRPLAERNTGYARRFADSIGHFRAGPLLEEASPAGEAERRAAGVALERHARLEFNIPGVTFGGRYDGSPVVVGDGTVPPPDAPDRYVPSACPGGRPPHLWLDDGRSLFDLFGAEWTLLRLGADPPDAAPFASAAARLGLRLDTVHLPLASARDLYEAPLALVRPDQIVAWRGATSAEAAGVLACASGWEGGPGIA